MMQSPFSSYIPNADLDSALSVPISYHSLQPRALGPNINRIDGFLSIGDIKHLLGVPVAESMIRLATPMYRASVGVLCVENFGIKRVRFQ